jgi:hypothetical protein
MNEFEELIRDNYAVIERSCTHQIRNWVMFIHDTRDWNHEEDQWIKDTNCERCCKQFMESLACSGEYLNFRLFINDIDKSDRYHLQQTPVIGDTLKLCYRHDSDSEYVVTFCLRKCTFRTCYEMFFYSQLLKWYNKRNASKIATVLQHLIDNDYPDEKDKFRNWRMIQLADFDETKYIELYSFEFTNPAFE